MKSNDLENNSECDVHELWLRILACIRFSDEGCLKKFINQLEQTLSPEDIHYLVQYLKTGD